MAAPTIRTVTRQLAIACTFIAFVFGVIIGHAGQPDPEVKVVQKTHTVYKTKYVTKTKTVKASLPESCADTIEALNRTVKTQGAVITSLGKLYLLLQQIPVKAIAQEGGANEAIVQILPIKRELETGAVDTSSTGLTMNTYLKTCLQEIAP